MADAVVCDLKTGESVNPPATFLNDKFFADALSRENLKLLSWKPLPLATGRSLVMTSAPGQEGDTRHLGIHGFLVEGVDPNGETRSLNMVLKSKPLYADVKVGWISLTAHHGEEFSKMVEKYCLEDLRDCHLREVRIAERALEDPILQSFMPKIYNTLIDHEKGIYAFLMEILNENDFSYLNSTGGQEWDDPSRETVFTSLADLHAAYFGEDLDAILDHLGDVFIATPRFHLQGLPYWRELLKVIKETYPQVFNATRENLVINYLNNLEAITEEIMEYPMTFCHHDVYFGNICLRQNPGVHQSRLCLYDWEFTTVNLPQRDLAQALTNLTRVGRDPMEQLEIINKLVDKYHSALVGALKSKLPTSEEIGMPKQQYVNPSHISTLQDEGNVQKGKEVSPQLSVKTTNNKIATSESLSSKRVSNINHVQWKEISERSKLNLHKLLDRELFQRMLDYCFLQVFFDRLGGVALLPRDRHGSTLEDEFEVSLKYLEARREFHSYL